MPPPLQTSMMLKRPAQQQDENAPYSNQNTWQGHLSKGSDMSERPAKKQTLSSSSASTRRVPLGQVKDSNKQGNDVAAARKKIKEAQKTAQERIRATRKKSQLIFAEKPSNIIQLQPPSAWAAAPPRETTLSALIPGSAIKSVPRSSAEARELKALKRASTSSNSSSIASSSKKQHVHVLNNSTSSNSTNFIPPSHRKSIIVSIPKTIPGLGMDIDYDEPLRARFGHIPTIQEIETDPMLGGEYLHGICYYLHDLEKRTLPDPMYMANSQPYLTWAMRTTLVEWLIQVHDTLRLLPETLYLTINLMDRFLSLKTVSAEKVQLVGVAAMLIACKYEEISVPCIDDFIHFVEGGYTREEIIQAERYLLGVLKYDISSPGPMTFLRRISKADNYDVHTRTLSKYLIEAAATDARFVGVATSLVTAGAMYLSRRVLTNENWTDMHCHTSLYLEHEIVPMAHGILDCVASPQLHPIVYEKYGKTQYMNASAFMQEYCRRINYMSMQQAHR
ncbi:hypothetical protein SmJEL517_g01137 [Synchytrium microbalum]|uniref:Uncharacterized protein n=1 Tax=Synchytrium microbalum TaxID=1806994 RepID=A0A507C502_9FUNG|nr:uncharacterized protein SmJEL517_g01137 [Synchytrium microbalum]TPX36630.1 hypothetical protein SmJEL517_g01137 [Synchytrium microbalum]